MPAGASLWQSLPQLQHAIEGSSRTARGRAALPPRPSCACRHASSGSRRSAAQPPARLSCYKSGCRELQQQVGQEGRRAEVGRCTEGTLTLTTGQQSTAIRRGRCQRARLPQRSLGRGSPRPSPAGPPGTASRCGTTRTPARSTAPPPPPGRRRCWRSGRTAPPAWRAACPAGRSPRPASAPGCCCGRAPAWAQAPQTRRHGRRGTRRWRPACRAARQRRRQPLPQAPLTTAPQQQRQRRAPRWRGSAHRTPAVLRPGAAPSGQQKSLSSSCLVLHQPRGSTSLQLSSRAPPG